MIPTNEALLVPACFELLTLWEGRILWRKGDTWCAGTAYDTDGDNWCVLDDVVRIFSMPYDRLFFDLAHRPSLDHVLYRATRKFLVDEGALSEADTLESAAMVMSRFSGDLDAAEVQAHLSVPFAGRPPAPRVGLGVACVWRGYVSSDPQANLVGGGSLLQALGVAAFAKEVFAS